MNVSAPALPVPLELLNDAITQALLVKVVTETLNDEEFELLAVLLASGASCFTPV